MSIYPVLCDYVALPTSQIKGPGSKLKLSEQKTTESKQHQIQQHLNSFREMTYAEEPNSASSTSRRSRASFHIFPEVTINDPFAGGQEMKKLINHLREKSSADEMQCLIKKSIQIFGLYGIELTIKVDEEDSDELYIVLSALIPELCLFPEGFIKRLEIRQIVICKQEEQFVWSKMYSEKDASFLFLDGSSKETQVCKELYKIIFERMMKVNSKIAEEWGKPASYGSMSSDMSTQEDMETAYMSLMQSSNHSQFKEKTEKLAKILEKHFPNELTEDWFKAHSREKTKLYRVKIGDSITISIESAK